MLILVYHITKQCQAESLEAGNTSTYVYWQVTLINDDIQQKYQ